MNGTLLSQLGGRDAIELVVALFYDRVLGDPELAPFFLGASMPRLQQLQTDFFCSALGGTPWKGRDLKTVHAGLHITDHHFDLVATRLQAVLGEVGVSPDHIRQVMAVVGTTRSQIVSSAARMTAARAAP